MLNYLFRLEKLSVCVAFLMSLLKTRSRSIQGSWLRKISQQCLTYLNPGQEQYVDRFARGVGPVSLLAGEYSDDRKIEDLKLLYRAYITNALSGGHMEDSKVLENSMTRKYMIKSHQISTLIKRARGVVCELAQTRLSNSLIQAVALLRQRNHEGVVSSLNDMLACDKAVPHSRPLSWEVPEELADLYTIYLKSDPNPGKWCRLQYLLGINDPAAALREGGDSFLNITEQEEGFVITM